MVETPEEVTTLAQVARAEPSMGPRIRIAREHAGMSVEELASHLGVLPESVAAWESDERTPRSNRVLTMAGVLNVSIAWLLEGREDARMGDSEPSLEDLRTRLETLRLHLGEATAQLESVEQVLSELIEAER